MMVKRLLAVLAAIALIVGAWVARDRVIESDAATADEPAEAEVLVCATELAPVCDAVASEAGLEVLPQEAWDTVAGLSAADAEPALWLTFSPFHEIVDIQRARAGATAFDATVTEVGSSRLAAIVRKDTTDTLVASCGTAAGSVDFGCVGEQTALTPAVSPVDGGIGSLTIAAAYAAQGGGTFIDFDTLLPWARSFRKASDRVALTGGTAAQTIQTKTTVSVALGAEAELSNSRAEQFDVLYADPVARATVVLVVPSGVSPPDGLADALGGAFVGRGWDPAGQGPSTGLPSAEQIIAIRTRWEELG